MKLNKPAVWTMMLAMLLGAGISISAAQKKAGNGRGQAWVAAMDSDHDGTVSQKEMDAFMDAQFKKADVDSDGSLNAKEMAQFRKSLMAIGKLQTSQGDSGK